MAVMVSRPPRGIRGVQWVDSWGMGAHPRAAGGSPRRSPDATSAARWDWGAVHAICLREARRVLGADPAAEDAAQEATFRAWRYSTQCRSPDPPIAWLATIARREALRIASTGGELLLSEPRRDQAAPGGSAPLSAD